MDLAFKIRKAQRPLFAETFIYAGFGLGFNCSKEVFVFGETLDEVYRGRPTSATGIEDWDLSGQVGEWQSHGGGMRNSKPSRRAQKRW